MTVFWDQKSMVSAGVAPVKQTNTEIAGAESEF
jgi:hypothetical protein